MSRPHERRAACQATLADGRRSRVSAWPLFIAPFVVISASRIASRLGLPIFDPTWVLLAGAAALLANGFFNGAIRPRVWRAGPDDRDGVHWWAAAAIAAIYEGTIGASLVASGLLGHAVSDLYHHRVNKVVTRSMAEFRAVLDTLLAAVIIVAVMKTGG